MLSIDLLRQVAQDALGNKYPITQIQYHTVSGKTVRFIAVRSNREGYTYNEQIPYYKTVFVNPYNAKLIYLENTKWEFFQVVLELHYSLMLGSIGELIIGWATLIFVVLLITGLILWYPKNKAAARQRFWFRWKKATSGKRKNYDLHNILGFYSMVLLLIIALTGLVWAFEWFENSVWYLANGARRTVPQKPVFSDSTLVNKVASANSIINYLTVRYPRSSRYMLVLPQDKNSSLSVIVPGEGRERYKFVQIYFDQYSGKEIGARFFDKKDTGEKLRNMNIDIHTGSILGLPGKVIAFFVALVAASLPITGLLIWWNKQKKNKVFVKARSGRLIGV